MVVPWLEQHILQFRLTPDVRLTHAASRRLLAEGVAGLLREVAGRGQDESVGRVAAAGNGVLHDLPHIHRAEPLLAFALDYPLTGLHGRGVLVPGFLASGPRFAAALLGGPDVDPLVGPQPAGGLDRPPGAEVVGELPDEVLEAVRLQVLEMEWVERPGCLCRHRSFPHVVMQPSRFVSSTIHDDGHGLKVASRTAAALELGRRRRQGGRHGIWRRQASPAEADRARDVRQPPRRRVGLSGR